MEGHHSNNNKKRKLEGGEDKAEVGKTVCHYRGCSKRNNKKCAYSMCQVHCGQLRNIEQLSRCSEHASAMARSSPGFPACSNQPKPTCLPGGFSFSSSTSPSTSLIPTPFALPASTPTTASFSWSSSPSAIATLPTSSSVRPVRNASSAPSSPSSRVLWSSSSTTTAAPPSPLSARSSCSSSSSSAPPTPGPGYPSTPHSLSSSPRSSFSASSLEATSNQHATPSRRPRVNYCHRCRNNLTNIKEPVYCFRCGIELLQ